GASPLNTADTETYAGRMVPGAVAVDAPVRDAQGNEGWWLSYLNGDFVLALFCGGRQPGRATLAALQDLAQGPVPVRIVLVGDGSVALEAPPGHTVVHDSQGYLAQRYDAHPGTCYLLRPDQHVAARRRAFDAAAMAGALSRALGRA
ncbi:MAG TPA: FAD-dependent oxidoreductase, partial [Bordetella sp.]|nr:FAD-dependent oxidoreductase [Bordetella sp.]